jgi:DNA-binding NarL/FixJ family response regulator
MGIRVFHVDDHESFSEKLREIVGPHADWIGAVHEADAAIPKVLELEPDVVLLDISLPGKSGFELAREINESLPATKVIIVSVHGERTYVEEALRMGVSGYVLKSAAAADIVDAIQAVHAGGKFVSASLGH